MTNITNINNINNKIIYVVKIWNGVFIIVKNVGFKF